MWAAAQTVIRWFGTVRWMNTPAAIPPGSNDPATRPSLRVLVADDSPVNRELACALLSHFGVDPVLAADGSQAVRLAREQAFDLVLMDLDMPVMDGLAATGQIRRFDAEHATHRQVPVVAYTSGPFPSDEGHLRRLGLDAVLRKPCLPRDLAACLERHCPTKFKAAC